MSNIVPLHNYSRRTCLIYFFIVVPRVIGLLLKSAPFSQTSHVSSRVDNDPTISFSTTCHATLTRSSTHPEKNTNHSRLQQDCVDTELAHTLLSITKHIINLKIFFCESVPYRDNSC